MALVGGRQDERVVQEDFAKDGAGTSSSVANFVKDGVPGVGIPRVEGGRSMSPALSVFRFVGLSFLLMHESALLMRTVLEEPLTRQVQWRASWLTRPP